MTVIDETMTLGELVNLHPELARELERWGLDYCCRGGARSRTRVPHAGLDESTIVAELSAATNQRLADDDWTSMAAIALVDHIVATHHVYLWSELPRLSALVAKVTLAHGMKHSELRELATVYDELRAGPGAAHAQGGAGALPDDPRARDEG